VKTALLGLHTGAESRGADHPEDRPRSREQQDALPRDPARSACSGVVGQCSLLVQMFWAASDDKQ
jgi:hypothetical protein